MDILLYNNSSTKNTINKSISLVKSLHNARFTNDTDLINPSIIIKFDDSILSSNYCYIDFLKRYYFIKDMTFLEANHILLSLEIDVLESHKTEILNNNVRVSRNEFKYNLYLDDDRMECLNKTQIQIKKLNGCEISSEKLGNADRCYVLTVANGGVN